MIALTIKLKRHFVYYSAAGMVEKDGEIITVLQTERIDYEAHPACRA